MSRKTHVRLITQKRNFDVWILVLTVFLIIFGLIMIFESSNVSAYRDFGDKYHYVKEQFIWSIVGFTGLLTAFLIPYKKFYNWSVPILIGTIIFLIVVFIPGIGIKTYGASRWIGFRSINFQPSELAKLTVIFYLSAWFSNKERGRLMPFLLLLGLIVGLVVLQPDLGTAIILSLISMMLYFLSGAPIWQFAMLIPCMLFATIGLAVSSPYRFKRLTTFLNPNSDPLGASYHIRQILIALGSGGWMGIGLGASRQKYQFLPEATTDSIFAIIGEDFGFIGSVVLLVIILIFLYKIYQVAKHAPDRHSYLLASGIFILFASQVTINLGAIVSLLPLTGVPLPFISYGGSSLVVAMTAIGIILNISRRSVKNS